MQVSSLVKWCEKCDMNFGAQFHYACAGDDDDDGYLMLDACKVGKSGGCVRSRHATVAPMRMAESKYRVEYNKMLLVIRKEDTLNGLKRLSEYRRRSQTLQQSLQTWKSDWQRSRSNSGLQSCFHTKQLVGIPRLVGPRPLAMKISSIFSSIEEQQ